MQEVINRSKLLILCETIQKTNAHAAEYAARPTQFKLQRQRVLNAKLLELTKQYQQEAIQEISSELDEEVHLQQHELLQSLRTKCKTTDEHITK